MMMTTKAASLLLIVAVAIFSVEGKTSVPFVLHSDSKRKFSQFTTYTEVSPIRKCVSNVAK